MFRRRRVMGLVFCAAAVFAWPGAPAAEVTQGDAAMMGLMFRTGYAAYSQSGAVNPEVIAIAEGSGGRSRGGGPADRYGQLAKGLLLIGTGQWNEALEVSTILDVRLGGKLFEPGDALTVRVFPLYDRPGDLEGSYLAKLQLIDSQGGVAGEDAQLFFNDHLVVQEITLRIPKDLERGRYALSYRFGERQGSGTDILTGQRTFYVIPGIRERVAELARKFDRVAAAGIPKKSRTHKLAFDTIAWHLQTYRRGLEGDVPGPYQIHPIFMAARLTEAGLALERMDFLNEISLAEELADTLLANRNPLIARMGDMRLAYASPVDGELVPFRIFVPEGFDVSKSYPLVVGLHGFGGDENAFMDRYDGLFKQNAQRRGYIVVSVNGRGPSGGYRGASGQDVIDVIDLIQDTYAIDAKRIYLTGHSMGGGGTVLVGFNNAERFAALAPIAGFGGASQLEKAKDMPLIISQGDEDALVPVASARAFYKAAQDLGMAQVKYIEKAGVEHLGIPTVVMDQLFDFFDEHSK